mmetsp:Transcript_38364/g.80593  ORF Transcript_38364/g.80593 Transcript_38364/m.80593 type:complete len:726 (-) Transcript_38364:259-2436(-)
MSRFCVCPICRKQVPILLINDHMDSSSCSAASIGSGSDMTPTVTIQLPAEPALNTLTPEVISAPVIPIPAQEPSEPPASKRMIDLEQQVFQCWPHLAQRIRCLASSSSEGTQYDVPSQGEFVLWWAQTGLRTSLNPALHTARLLARHLNLPLLVIGTVRLDREHATARRCAFELEALLSLCDELRGQRVPMLMYADVDGGAGQSAAALTHFASRAAAIVVEEMPVEPYRSWTSRLVAATASPQRPPLLAVDAACVVPMQSVPRAYDSARAFRAATAATRAARLAAVPAMRAADAASAQVHLPPLDMAALVGPTAGRLTTAPMLSGQQLCEAVLSVVKRMAADTAVPPVLVGEANMRAADARWRGYAQRGLRSYAARRNNAVDSGGTSRCSAYLHYGLLSPFALATDASAARASKFADELLIWRELAYSFCYYRYDQLGSLAALPNWAQRTLSLHANDARPKLVDMHALERGESGDSVWDAAQQLLVHTGELHNNLRMTWGKSLLFWTRSPQAALSTTLHLNHRFALDGCDPCSYGGVLWCFGLFDGPKGPERPVCGSLRTRATAKHAKIAHSLIQLARAAQQAGGGCESTAALVASINSTDADNGQTDNQSDKQSHRSSPSKPVSAAFAYKPSHAGALQGPSSGKAQSVEHDMFCASVKALKSAGLLTQNAAAQKRKRDREKPGSLNELARTYNEMSAQALSGVLHPRSQEVIDLTVREAIPSIE